MHKNGMFYALICIDIHIITIINSTLLRLINDLGYGPLLNPNWLIKLVVIYVGNHWGLLL